MSNIKLKDHNWAAEGIYDTNQSKSQQTINSDVNTKIGQATLQTSSKNLSGATNELKGRADTLDSKYDNVVTVANTQPSSQYNKVWLPLTVSEGTQVPTWAEHQELSSAIDGKAYYVNLGSISRTTYTTVGAAMAQTFRLITITAKPVMFQYEWGGSWSGIAYKYATGSYGTMYATYPVNNNSYFAYMINGTFYCDLITPKSELTATQNDLAPVLTQFKADTNLVAGNLRMYDNQLYRVIATVNSGDDLIVGTNVATANLTNFSDSSLGARNGYVKCADGTLIQWGNDEYYLETSMTQVGSLNIYFTSKQIMFPVPFAHGNYVINASSQYSTGYVLPSGGQPNTTTYATIWIYDIAQRQAGTTAKQKIWWQAIGRWRA